jgi:hypothetical protein
MVITVIAGILGILLGILGASVLFVGSYLSLLPWGLVGVVFGYLSSSYKKAILNGIVYGFLLVVAFMISGYRGTNPIIAVLVFFGILGLVGAVCGLVLGLIGHFLKEKIN